MYSSSLIPIKLAFSIKENPHTHKSTLLPILQVLLKLYKPQDLNFHYWKILLKLTRRDVCNKVTPLLAN